MNRPDELEQFRLINLKVLEVGMIVLSAEHENRQWALDCGKGKEFEVESIRRVWPKKNVMVTIRPVYASPSFTRSVSPLDLTPI